MKLEFSRQIFEKYSNITFHVNPSSESRVVPCGQTWRSQYLLFAIVRTRLKMITRCSCTPLSKSTRGFTVKVKVNWFFTMPWRHIGQKTYSSTHSEARTWMKMSGQLQAPAALHPRKNPGTHWRADWVGPSTGLNSLALPGLQPRTVQLLAWSLHLAISCPDCRNVAPLKETFVIPQFISVLYTNTNGLRYQFTKYYNRYILEYELSKIIPLLTKVI